MYSYNEILRSKFWIDRDFSSAIFESKKYRIMFSTAIFYSQKIQNYKLDTDVID